MSGKEIPIDEFEVCELCEKKIALSVAKPVMDEDLNTYLVCPSCYREAIDGEE